VTWWTLTEVVEWQSNKKQLVNKDV